MSNIIRDNYIFHESFHDAMSELPDSKYGRIMRAINEFALYGKEPDSFNGIELMVWKLIYPILAKSRNKANGKAGAPKNNQNALKKQSKFNQNSIKIQSNDNQKKIKENPLFPPFKETSPTPLKEINPSIIPQENVYTLHAGAGAYDAFKCWLESNCPYIVKNIPMMSNVEFFKLKERFGSQAISEVCLDLENRKDLRKKYSNLYRTLLNWLKRRDDGTNRSNSTTSEQRAADAAAIIVRRLAEDDARM